MIELTDVSKIYSVGKTDFYALKHVSVTIGQGEFVSICGASGSGKSTLLNIMGLLDKPSKGQYRLDGVEVGKLRDEKQARIRNEKLGFVLQDFGLINSQTVLYNVMLPLLFGKCPYGKLRSKALAALKAVGLANQAGKKVNQLSGGQRQRVAVARAIVGEAAVVLADEPTGQLDSHTGVQIMELLKMLNDRGVTVVIVTHDSKVAAYARRTLTISDGKIVSDTLNT